MSNKTQQLLEIDRQRVFHASTHLKQYAAGELEGLSRAEAESESPIQKASN